MSLFGLFKSRVDATPEQVAEFRDLCERTSRLVVGAGHSVLPYRSPELSRFKGHGNPQRVIESLRVYTEVLEAATEAGEDLNDSPKLVWRMIQRLGFIPQHDIFDRLEAEDTIEIYTTDNWQIFRNMRFFDVVSFTVEEMCTLVWNRDTERDSKITWDLLEMMFKIKTGTLKTTLDLSKIPRHKMREVIGEGWLTTIQMRLVSPLRRENTLVAAIATNRSEVIERTSRHVKQIDR